MVKFFVKNKFDIGDFLVILILLGITFFIGLNLGEDSARDRFLQRDKFVVSFTTTDRSDFSCINMARDFIDESVLQVNGCSVIDDAFRECICEVGDR